LFESALSTLLCEDVESVQGVNITQVHLYSGRRIQEALPPMTSVGGSLVTSNDDTQAHILSDPIEFDSEAKHRTLISTRTPLQVEFSVVVVSSETSPTKLAQDIRLVMLDIFNYTYSSTITAFDEQLVQTKAALLIPLSS